MRDIAKKRQPKVTELTKLVNSDPDVRIGAASALSAHGCGTLGELAARKPKVFDSLFEALTDLAAEAPYEGRPGFLS